MDRALSGITRPGLAPHHRFPSLHRASDPTVRRLVGFIAFDNSDQSSRSHKTGHVFAVDQSATRKFEAEFVAWDTNLWRIFSPQSIHSFGYRYEEAFSFGTPCFVLPKPAGPKIDLKRPHTPPHAPIDDKRRHRGGPLVAFQQPGGNRPPPQTLQPAPGLPPAQPAPLVPDRRGSGTPAQSQGKSSAVVKLLRWTGITGTASLPNTLMAWRSAAPAGINRTTPKLSGKFLCFKFCTEGLFCEPVTGRACTFAHIDLAQPNPWNKATLRPLVGFMAQPGVPELGITFTPDGHRATTRD